MAKKVKVYDVPTLHSPQNMVTVPAAGATLVSTTATQTLTNKTLTAPTVTAPVISGAATVATGATFTNGTFTTPIQAFPFQSVAGTGSTIADAAAITATAPGIIQTTSGNNSVGVILPVAAAGKVYFIKNTSTDKMLVYAQVNSTINAIAANTAISMATVSSAVFVATGATAWQTIPTVPS